jgi:hypothetical protein
MLVFTTLPSNLPRLRLRSCLPLRAFLTSRDIDLDEALLLAVLFCFGLLFLSWRYFCLQRSGAARRRPPSGAPDLPSETRLRVTQSAQL